MTRGLPQQVIERERREVSLDDKFCFECQRCGSCCFRCEIVLTPYDILRLCQGLRMTTGEFLDRCARINLGPESGLPICSVDFEKANRWVGNSEEQSLPCPFLSWEDGRFACGVYAFRPGCCRSYPLFRMAQDEGEPRFYLQEIRCLAAETDEEYTVARWIEHESLAPYHRGNQQFIAQIMALMRARQAWPEEFLQMLAGLWYDYSRVPDGKSLARKHALAMQAVELLVDAMIKLQVGRERDDDEVQTVWQGAKPG